MIAFEDQLIVLEGSCKEQSIVKNAKDDVVEAVRYYGQWQQLLGGERSEEMDKELL